MTAIQIAIPDADGLFVFLLILCLYGTRTQLSLVSTLLAFNMT